MMAKGRKISFGVVPLTDAAVPLIAARKGFAAEEGLDLDLSIEFSWASVRDKVSFGVLDCAQMLAGIPLAAALGAGQLRVPMVAPFSLGLNGNAITVSTALHAEMCEADPEAMQTPRTSSARALAAVIAKRKRAGGQPLTFAMVFPFSSHNYELRYWMATAEIDPDRDVSIVVVPPPKMVNVLEEGVIAGYCVGEPWNLLAVERDVGRIVTTKYDIWNNSPEKVVGMRQAWAEEEPESVAALIRALYRAALWADEPDNRLEIAALLVDAGLLNVPVPVIESSLLGRLPNDTPRGFDAVPDYNVFARYAATFPWRSHAVWTLTQMARWGQIGRDVDVRATAERVYRPDVYRAALAGVAVEIPATDYKCEGTHDAPYMIGTNGTALHLGPDRFVDHRVFDPEHPDDYLRAISDLGRRGM